MENSSKARQGSKTKGTEHCISRCENFARCISRCEFLSRKGGNFAHLKTRCEIESKVRNPLFKVRIPQMPFSHTTVQGAKIFAQCEIHFWHTSAIFAHLKPIFAPCETRCENFAHLISRCENFAHLISRCEFLSRRGGIFAHPNPRCEILSPRCENFAR